MRLATLVLLLSIMACLGPAAHAQDSAPAPATATQTPVATSPREALTTFLDAMNAVRNQHPEAMDRALAMLDLQQLPEYKREAAGRTLAEQLFDVLDAITIDLTLVPNAPDEQTAAVNLGTRPQVTLHFVQSNDGTWRIATTDLDKELPRWRAALTEQALESAGEEGMVDSDLASPRATMRTFIEGMNRWADGGMEQALKTLDLSQIDPRIRAEKGKELATYLKRILDRHGRVIYQEIPLEHDDTPYVYLKKPAGKIAIGPVSVEGAGTEWKFTAGTIDTLPALYDAYKDKAVVAGSSTETPTVAAVLVRDWVGAHAPFLLDRSLFLENWQWLGLFLIILVGMIASQIGSAFLLGSIRRWFMRSRLELSADTESQFVRPVRIAIMAWIWYALLGLLNLPSPVLVALKVGAETLAASAVVWAVYRLIDVLGQYLTEKAAKTHSKFDDLLVPLVVRTLKVFVVVFGIVFIAETLNIDYKSLLAGLGLGGLAFALAAKDTVSNVFGSLTVLIDRPFQIGDWVVIGDIEGSVETMGIRSTRIRTFYNSQVTIPNANLISASIDNMGARRYRRFRTMISVAYDTPPEKIDAFCEGIRELIRRHPYTRKDYYHVYLNEFAASSLNILLYVFHETPEWSTELRERHRLMLDIIRLAEQLGVEFAFPTQTLYLRKEEYEDAQLREPKIGEGEALKEGRRRGADLAREFKPGGPKPPPVSFDPIREDPPGNNAPRN